MSKLYIGNSYFCGTIIPIGADSSCRWPHKEIKYYENMSFPGLSREDVVRAVDESWSSWAKVCDIKPRRVYSASEANVISNHGPIDGSYGTLGWSYIPCGVSSTTQLTQLYDNGESWVYNFFLAVLNHENGHMIGLSHSSGRNLMAPSLSDIIFPQAGDIKEAQDGYGPPTNNPVPVPPEPPKPVPPTPPVPPQPSPPLNLVPGKKFQGYSLAVNETKVFNLIIPKTLFGLAKPYQFILKGQDKLIMAIYDKAGTPLGSSGKAGRMQTRLRPGNYDVHVRLVDQTKPGNFEIGVAKA